MCVHQFPTRPLQVQFLVLYTTSFRFQQQYSGSVYDELKVFVPSNATLVRSQWFTVKESVRVAIGDVPNDLTVVDVAKWRNSPSDILGLYNLALNSTDIFKLFVNETILGATTAYASYGPGDAFIVKSLSSLTNKAERIIQVGSNYFNLLSQRMVERNHGRLLMMHYVEP
jgi:hypothetical protein